MNNPFQLYSCYSAIMICQRKPSAMARTGGHWWKVYAKDAVFMLSPPISMEAESDTVLLWVFSRMLYPLSRCLPDGPTSQHVLGPRSAPQRNAQHPRENSLVQQYQITATKVCSRDSRRALCAPDDIHVRENDVMPRHMMSWCCRLARSL